MRAGPIHLPREGGLGEGDAYVPAGWFLSGGDPDAPGALDACTVWVDAFVVRRDPVTNREYLEFLNDLIAIGRGDEAEERVPRLRAARRGELGAPAYELADGGYRLGVDADGDQWLPEWPVVFVDHPGAVAFAAWEAERSGEAWRLPTEVEWEKTARGVDGRFHPWGDRFDPTFCRMRRTLPGGHGMIAPVGQQPVDTSPYGARDTAGNVGEWCAAEIESEDGRRLRVRRGGSWTFSPRGVRSAARWSESAHFRAADLGFRLARSY
jgi:serine/threonine-protein kinase